MADVMADQVRVRVPATSANLGPGFDCLGLALGLYLEVAATAEDGEGVEIVARGEGEGEVPLDDRNAVYRGVARAFADAGRAPGRIRLDIDSRIPLASGLGSSSAALVAGLAAGTALCGLPLDREVLLRQGVDIEGHPDNVAPCVLGGIVIAALEGEQVTWARIDPPPDLAAVVAVPDFSLRTSQARQALPDSVARADAVFNASRVGLMVAALLRGDYDLLRTGMQDRLHQPQREALVPGMAAVLAAARAAGALGAVLSGAGPTLLALGQGGEEAIAAAMRSAWSAEGIQVQTQILPLEGQGVRVERDVR